MRLMASHPPSQKRNSSSASELCFNDPRSRSIKGDHMRVFGLSVLIAVSVVAVEAFAVAQTNPPPQDYQQPPPGYQQQPPPGYQQQPPPGYQQQPPPGYQQQPPPGYQQQPPPQTYGYPSQPGY